MPWLETNPMDERVRFIVALDEGLYSVAELSERFGVSRQCGDKWRRRYLAEGFAGLADPEPHTAPLSAQDQRGGSAGGDRAAAQAPKLGPCHAARPAGQAEAGAAAACAEHGR